MPIQRKKSPIKKQRYKDRKKSKKGNYKRQKPKDSSITLALTVV